MNATKHLEPLELSQFVDGELDAPRTETVRRHLETCAACRNLSTSFQALDAVFRTAETVEPPPFLWTRIEADLAERASPRSFGRFVPRWAWAASVTAVFLAASLLMVRDRGLQDRWILGQIENVHQDVVEEQANPFRQAPAGGQEAVNPFSTLNWKQDRNPFKSAL